MIEKIFSFYREHDKIVWAAVMFVIFLFIGHVLRRKQWYIVSRIISVLVVILSIVFGTFSPDITIVFSLSIVFVCLNEILNTVVKLDDILKELKKEKEEIQNHISHNPVFKSKNSHKELVDNLPKICAKDSVLEFFENTFTQVETKGLINIDTTLVDYTNKLKGIAESAKLSIIGTYTTRPITTYRNRENDSFKVYNNTLSAIASRKKNKVEVIRVVVLSDNEISEIVKANKDPQCEVPGAKITETDWFINYWCKNITVLWTSTNKINEFFNNKSNNFKELIHLYGGTKISDFAIFDNKLYVTWREYDTKNISDLENNYGNMILNWNNVVSALCSEFSRDNLTTQQVAFNSFEDLCNNKKNGKK